MAIFSVSDIIIAVTLVVNALALVSSKLPRLNHRQRGSASADTNEENIHDDNCSYGMNLAEQSVSLLNDRDIRLNDQNQTEDLDNYTGTSLMMRVRTLVFGIRKFSCIIIIWNAFFFILMVFVFGS